MVHKLNILSLLGRDEELLTYDIEKNEDLLSNIVSNSKFLVLGAAGSIGQAVSKEIFKRNPEKLHVVDISENNLVELIRDLRSSYGYIKGEFKTFAIDCTSVEFEVFFKYQLYRLHQHLLLIFVFVKIFYIQPHNHLRLNLFHLFHLK